MPQFTSNPPSGPIAARADRAIAEARRLLEERRWLVAGWSLIHQGPT